MTGLPKRQLGRYLRDWRTQAGLTIAQAARLMEWGASTLQRLEKGQAERIRTIDIQELCRIYGIPELFADGLIGLARQTASESWWHSFGGEIPANFDVYPSVEAAAEELLVYQPELVPGLLQAPDYLRAVTWAHYTDESEADRERRVQQRMQRQALVTRKTSPARIHAVIGEAALRRVVGGTKAMAAQLRHLADLGTRDNVSVQILPFAAGAPLGIGVGQFTVLDFGIDRSGRPVEPPLVYTAGLTGDLYLESPSDLRRYDRAHECLRRCALDVQQSRQLLRQLAKEYVG